MPHAAPHRPLPAFRSDSEFNHVHVNWASPDASPRAGSFALAAAGAGGSSGSSTSQERSPSPQPAPAQQQGPSSESEQPMTSLGRMSPSSLLYTQLSVVSMVQSPGGSPAGSPRALPAASPGADAAAAEAPGSSSAALAGRAGPSTGTPAGEPSTCRTPGLLTLPGPSHRTIRALGIGSNCVLASPAAFTLGATAPAEPAPSLSNVQAALEEAGLLEGAAPGSPSSWRYKVHSCRWAARGAGGRVAAGHTPRPPRRC